MSDVVIRVEGLGKKYLIGHRTEGERYIALRDVIARGARGLARSAADMLRGRPLVAGDEVEEFWALKEVSFEVKRGEVVGVIGRNGAGKSTLLKILSRITEPSAGRVTIKGRVASLLEVGTGFHPELTGRENIYLNGSILGMTRAEIRKRFDEIVAFAEVDKFLDTPVKRYSSGMYVRLAFAVAAHLEPEILLVDEVLAVGDAEFQRKCLGKMSDAAGQGRTVLFVSHNMAAVQVLCRRSIHIASGALVHDGNTDNIVASYLEHRKSTMRSVRGRAIAVQEGLVLEEVKVAPTPMRSGDAVEFEFRFGAERGCQIRECAVLIYSVGGLRVAIVDLRASAALPLAFEAGRFSILARITGLPLVEGDYTLGLYLVTDGFAGDLYELNDFSLSAARTATALDYAPYPREVRGVVDLNAEMLVLTNRRARVA